MKYMQIKVLKRHVDNNEDILLLDVREPWECVHEYIKNAVFIPLGGLCREALPSHASRVPIIVYCHSGKRSQYACMKLLAEDPTLDLYSLEGGISSWKEASFL